MADWKKRAGLLAICGAFFAAGMLFVPRLGIEADEAILGNGMYEFGAPWYSWKVGGSELPVMMMSYLGALKTWLYSLLFLVTPPRALSLRLPTMLIAAATLWLFFSLLDRTVSRRAAWIGVALLACDSSYLLLNVPDFGFVTLQFFFKLSAMLLILRFHRSGSRWALAGGFFLIGLALWDKAVFLWVLFGLAVATVAVFPREIRRSLTARNIAVAGVSLLIGALPLVIYNIARPLDTLRSNAKLERNPLLAKVDLLERTLEGEVMFGFLTADNPGPRPGEPQHWFQSLSLRVAGWTGHPSRDLTLVALLLVVPALFFLWKTPARAPILFGLITCAATWLPIGFAANAGFAAQHTILLWPFPFLAITAALAQAPARLGAATCAVLCLSSVAVTNQYYADLIRNGPAIRWTDAIDPLNRYLIDSKPEMVFGADWGFVETLNLLSEGTVPVSYVDITDKKLIDRMVAGPNYLFVCHEPNFTYQPELRAAVEEAARQAGLQEEALTTIADRNGRPTFDVFRFRKAVALQ
jgi:4-amino-4-deoxy-L-arabinose transferase-like glycosyltransferase